MEPPAPKLRDELDRCGITVSLARATAAFRAEIAYYLEHHTEGRQGAPLDDLRDRCADVLRSTLQEPALDRATARRVMLSAIRFHRYADAGPALVELRERGMWLGVASNWDCSLHEVIAQVGLARLVDGVVSSAEAGAPKPNPALFEAALDMAGCSPREAVYVGDSPETDIEGARAVGLDAVLLHRGGGGGEARAATERPDHPRPVVEIAALTELAYVI